MTLEDYAKVVIEHSKENYINKTLTLESAAVMLAFKLHANFAIRR